MNWWRSFPLRWIAGLVLLCVVLCAASTPLLLFAGRQLIHADPVERIDAILVLSGRMDRVFEAAELFRAGYAPIVVLTTEPEDPTDEVLRRHGIDVETRIDLKRRVLNALGVPPSSVQVIPDIVTSTAAEADAFSRGVTRHPIRSVMLVTSAYHTRRAQMAFGHRMDARNIRVIVRSSTLGTFRADSWWRSRETLRDGISEWQKLIYYSLVEFRPWA